MQLQPPVPYRVRLHLRRTPDINKGFSLPVFDMPGVRDTNSQRRLFFFVIARSLSSRGRNLLKVGRAYFVWPGAFHTTSQHRSSPFHVHSPHKHPFRDWLQRRRGRMAFEGQGHVGLKSAIPFRSGADTTSRNGHALFAAALDCA